MISDSSIKQAIDEMGAEQVSFCASVAMCGLQELLRSGLQVATLGDLWRVIAVAEKRIDGDRLESILSEVEALRDKCSRYRESVDRDSLGVVK